MFALAIGVVCRAYIMHYIKLPYTVQILVVSRISMFSPCLELSCVELLVHGKNLP